MKNIAVLLIATVLFAGVAFAHGGEAHVMGTVAKLTDTAIVVEVPSKKGETPKPNVTVNLLPTTKFEKNGTSVALKDLKVGDRVVIHAGKNGGQMEAHTIRIGMSTQGMHHK